MNDIAVASDRVEKRAHVWARDELDWYVEPERVTRQLLAVETFGGPILDPACGGGNIVKTCRAAGLQARGSDIVDRTDGAEWFAGTRDFLDPLYLPDVPEIICNPPFFRAKGTEHFIRRALAVARVKVAIFTSIKFLAGQARGAGLWVDHPPTRVWIICERPSCPPGEWLKGGNPAAGGTDDWIWVVWDKRAPVGPTQLGWLRKDRGSE